MIIWRETLWPLVLIAIPFVFYFFSFFIAKHLKIKKQFVILIGFFFNLVLSMSFFFLLFYTHDFFQCTLTPMFSYKEDLFYFTLALDLIPLFLYIFFLFIILQSLSKDFSLNNKEKEIKLKYILFFHFISFFLTSFELVVLKPDQYRISYSPFSVSVFFLYYMIKFFFSRF